VEDLTDILVEYYEFNKKRSLQNIRKASGPVCILFTRKSTEHILIEILLLQRCW